MSWKLLRMLMVVGLASSATVSAGSFEVTTFRGFERTRPAPDSLAGSYQIDTSRPGLAVVVSQSCEVRSMSDDKREFFRGLGVTVGLPEVLELYSRELQVEQHGIRRWIPFQDETLDDLLRNACDTKQIGITVRYMAAHGKLGVVYVGIGYTSVLPPLPEPTSCFASEMLGVKIGAPLAEVRERLVKRYGPETIVPRNGERQMWAYPVDADHETTLIIGDSGSGPREKVFSVQVSGPPNPDLILPLGLKLGRPTATLAELLPAPTSRKATGDGYQMLSFERSPCSVEVRGDVLASVLIVGDPNYFEE